jgi:AcrR family transcriptional regulator
MPLILKSSARTDKIVQAAGRLFAYQGYHGTSTRQIARLADVSENTLFRHFDHKEDLFWSTLRSHSTGLKLQRDLMERIANCEPPEVVLPKILELLTDTVSYRPELLRLLAVAFLELHPKAEAFSQELLSPALAAISNYLEINIKSGKLRNLDPTMITAALMTTTLMHREISRLIDRNKPLLSYQEVNRAHANFWLDLLTPRMRADSSPNERMKEEHPV